MWAECSGRSTTNTEVLQDRRFCLRLVRRVLRVAHGVSVDQNSSDTEYDLGVCRVEVYTNLVLDET